MRNLLIAVSILILANISALAQFNSGSTGADGALDLSTMTCPNNLCRVQVPESGVLNYTTINIPTGKTVRFTVNSRNTALTLLSQGDVVVNGNIDVSSVGLATYTCGNIPAEVAPGGFRGGQQGLIGFGPGAGTQSTPNGKWIGPLSLMPLVGGSGGFGNAGTGGGHGGGAITIASSTSVSGTGSILANGSAHSFQDGWYCWNSSWGSGGAIRIVANSVNLSGGLSACANGSACGVIKLEATSLTFTGTSSPAAVLSPINALVIPSEIPVLSLISIGGFQVPAYAGTRFDTVDILLPNQIPDPVSVVVGAVNIPVGTEVRVGFVSGSPAGSSTPCNLSGTFASSTCTATISNLNRTAVTYLLATAVFDPPAPLAKHNPKGKNQVAKIKLESVLGGQTRYVFVDKKGNEIAQNKLKELLAYFNM